MSSSNIDTIGQSNEGSTALSNTLSPLKPEVDDDNYDDDPQAFSLIRFFGVCYVFRSKSRCNGKVNVGSVAATLGTSLCIRFCLWPYYLGTMSSCCDVRPIWGC